MCIRDRYKYRQRLWSVGGEQTWRPLRDGSGPFQSVGFSFGGAYDAAETPEAGGREPLGRLSEWGGRAGLSAGLAGGEGIAPSLITI